MASSLQELVMLGFIPCTDHLKLNRQVSATSGGCSFCRFGEPPPEDPSFQPTLLSKEIIWIIC